MFFLANHSSNNEPYEDQVHDRSFEQRIWTDADLDHTTAPVIKQDVTEGLDLSAQKPTT
jgi:hypothetical protein